MTKILLSGFLCLTFSFTVEACKPAPLSSPECLRPDVEVDYKKYLKLLKKVQNYQKRLSSAVITPERVHSCFNNHFAVHYGIELKRFLDAHKRLACRHQIQVVSRNFKHLISADTEEFRTIRNSETKKDLEDQAAIIKAEMYNVLPGI